MKPTDLPALDFIKYLNARKGWHGKQYRSICGQWLQKQLDINQPTTMKTNHLKTSKHLATLDEWDGKFRSQSFCLDTITARLQPDGRVTLAGRREIAGSPAFRAMGDCGRGVEAGVRAMVSRLEAADSRWSVTPEGVRRLVSDIEAAVRPDPWNAPFLYRADWGARYRLT